MNIKTTWCSYLATALLVSSPAVADDGGISFGGTPHLLSGHKSVSMKSEVVRMNIGKDLVQVSCEFLFHNDGPASTVRMGFPDTGEGIQDPYQGEPVPKNPHGAFVSYDSWVDGKKLPTKVVAGNEHSVFWHTKTVTFPANSDCKIVDKYSVKPGVQETNDSGGYRQAEYVLHTGASWLGPIGSADIIVTFAPKLIPGTILLKSADSIKPSVAQLDWTKQPAGLVIYNATCTPSVKEQTLTFHKTNFEPTVKDDIHLIYGHTPAGSLSK